MSKTDILKDIEKASKILKISTDEARKSLELFTKAYSGEIENFDVGKWQREFYLGIFDKPMKLTIKMPVRDNKFEFRIYQNLLYGVKPYYKGFTVSNIIYDEFIDRKKRKNTMNLKQFIKWKRRN